MHHKENKQHETTIRCAYLHPVA